MSTTTDRPSLLRRRLLIGAVLTVLALLCFAAWAFATGLGSRQDDPAPSPSTSPSVDPEARAAALELMRAEPRREEGDPFAKGEVDAPVVLIEFADYRCPYCAKHAQEVAPVLEKYVDDGTLRIEWRDLPIFGEESTVVHHAARAAGAQGKFWEFHEAVFAQTPLEGHRSWSDEELRALAQEVGVPDLARFDADRAAPETAEAVEENRRHATEDLGITATPAFIVGDVFVPGAYPLATFVQQIEEQARR